MDKQRTIFPRLANGEIVQIGRDKYKARWQSFRYYRFELQSDRKDKDGFTFTRTEQQVSDAIQEKKIKRLN